MRSIYFHGNFKVGIFKVGIFKVGVIMKYLYHIISNMPHWIVLDDWDLNTVGDYALEYEFSTGVYSRGYSCYFERTGRVFWGCDGDNVENSTMGFCQWHGLSDEDTFFFLMLYGDTLPEHRKDVHPLHDTILNMPRYRTLAHLSDMPTLKKYGFQL